MPNIIETTSNQMFRAFADLGAHFDCIPVKRVKDGFADRAKARPTLINKRFVLRVVA